MKRGLPSKYLWSDTDDEWKGALERDSTPKLISSTERRSRQSARAAKPPGLKPKAVNKLSCAQSPTNRVLELQGRTGKSLQSWFARAREGSDLDYIECSINLAAPISPLAIAHRRTLSENGVCLIYLSKELGVVQADSIHPTRGLSVRLVTPIRGFFARAASSHILTPVKSDGSPNPSRKVVYVGEAQLLTTVGALPSASKSRPNRLRKHWPSSRVRRRRKQSSARCGTFRNCAAK
jgi:hypothetical protein